MTDSAITRPIRAYVRVAACALLVATSVAAQDQPETVTLENFRTPSSPAFVLLGVAPTSIERPTTPKMLAASLYSAVRNSDDLVPRNYAVEVAPFWLKSHPTISAEEYYRVDGVGTSLFNPGEVGSTLWQTLSISAASSDLSKQSTAVQGTGLGLGLRGLLVQGVATQELVSTMGKIQYRLDNFGVRARMIGLKMESVLAALEGSQPPPDPVSSAVRANADARLVGTLAAPAPAPPPASSWRQSAGTELRPLSNEIVRLYSAAEANKSADQAQRLNQTEEAALAAAIEHANEFVDALDNLLKTPDSPPGAPPDAAAVTALQAAAQAYEAARTELSTERSALARQVPEQATRKIGFNLETALGATMNLIDDSFDNTKFGSVGFWLTPTYRLESPALDILGVTRVIHEDTPDRQTLFDVGGRLVWEIIPTLAVSGEFLQRFSADSSDPGNDRQRASGSIEYRLLEGTYLFASFGQDFKGSGGNEDLISIFGLNVGLGSTPKLIVGQ